MNKKLIVISAPSGAGKTTLCQRLLEDFPQLVLSISTTTRPPRGQEKHGREYFFTSKQEFEQMIREGRFAEWALVHGNYYGTSREVIENSFRRGKHVLLDIDVQGAESLRKAYPEQSFTVFISPPSLEVLESRLRGRKTDSEEAIHKRMKNAEQEMKDAPKFHYIIINDDLERAYQELRAAVEKQLLG